MSVLKNFRALARYHVLTPVAVLAALAAGPTVAADKTNPAGTTLTTQQSIDAGSGYTNNGTISISTNTFSLINAGAVSFVLNNGTISNTINPAVRLDATGVSSFINNGTVTSGSSDVIRIDNVPAAGVVNVTNNGTISNPQPTLGAGIFVEGHTTLTANITNTGEIITGDNAIRVDNGIATIVNSGKVTGRNGRAILLNGQGNSVKLLTGSELLGGSSGFGTEIEFNGGNDTFDFSGFYGTAIIRTQSFDTTTGDTLVAGDRSYVTTGGANPTFTIFDQTGATSMGSVTSGTLGSIQTAIANELGGFSAGNLFDPSAVSGYAAAPRQTSAEKAADAAVLSDLDVAEPSKGKVWGTAFGGVSGDSAPVALSNVYGGIVMGTHFELDAQTRLGGLVGYSMSKFNVANGQQVIESQTGTLGVHGMTDLGMIELNYALLGGGSSHASSRQVMIGGVGLQTVTASYASWFINPSLGLAIPVMSDDTTTVKLAASASYIYGGVGSYTERSANFTANVGAMPISVFEARLELNGEKIIAPTAHGDVRIRGKVGVLAEANMGSSNIPLTLNGTATTFANPGTTTYGAYVGAGLSADIGSGLVLDAGVDFTARADGNNAASGKVSLIGSF